MYKRQADRTFGNFSKRHGIHIFELGLSNDYPQRISGSFFDTSPYNRIGVIELFRDKAQRDAFVRTRCQGKIQEGRRAFTSKVMD